MAKAISLAALGMSALILGCAPSLEQQDQQAKQEGASRILSDTHSHAVMTADTVNALEYGRIANKEGDVNGARADSADAAHRIVDIVFDAEVVDKNNHIIIGGMDMGGGSSREVDKEALAQNPELIQAVRDYHDAIVFLARNRANNR